MHRSLMAMSLVGSVLLLVGCSAGAPASPTPAAATPTAATPTAAASATPTAAPTPATTPAPTASDDTPCDPYYGPCGGPSAPPSAAGSTVVITDSAGATPHLLGPSGNALYTFDSDSANQSACNTGCSDTWPPLTVTTGYNLQAGGHEADYATITRSDGSLQLTYLGKPLYYYSGDASATDTNGDGLFGKWHLAIQQP